MRHVSQDGLDLVKRFESFSATIYICPAGKQTIGYGHVIVDEAERERFAGGISEEDAETLLARDMETVERTVLRLIQVPLTDGQFDALASFAFNVGGGCLQRSTLRSKVNRGEHAAVPAEFLKYVHGGGRVLPGLVRRRRAEGRLYSGAPRAATA